MVNKSPIALNPQEHREDAPPSWVELQDSLAQSAGLALLLVDGHQPPAIVVSNNNSVCHTFQTSPEHAELCEPYCGAAHARAIKAGGIVEFKCHAGLSCFTKPIEIGNKRNLAIIGGRTFVKSSDYQQLRERLRTGDLQGIASDEVFSNILFAEPQRLTEMAERLDRAVHRQRVAASNGSGIKQTPAAQATAAPAPAPVETLVKTPTPAAKEASRRAADQYLEREVQRLQNELEYRTRFADSLQHFLERISCADPVKTYNSIISHLKEMLRSERASIMVLDEAANQLILKAASGLATDPSAVGPIPVGEGVSGEVIDTGKPMLVTNLRSAGRKPAPAERHYKTDSFISYPIAIGGRKVGVLNITDKSSGDAYDEVDLSLLEIIGPQVALALERAEWQERASEFELRSITDQLTGLPNLRYLEKRMPEELNRSTRYNYPMSFLMIDIDDFKIYNDRNGHQAGNDALQLTANCLKEALRAADVALRYGGEEFCILLPQTGHDEARVIAERIRQRVRTEEFPHGKSQPLGRVTVSIGVSTFSNELDTAEKIIGGADRALYQAKHHGKDRVESYE
ncbi:MAG TPA: diguanylate cyclase [Pyrinomonadaceae bacterium]|nr:diguanylate cyclase [Pyrinomonadaceae bacterium]